MMDAYTPHYGQQVVFEPGTPVYRRGEAPGAQPVFYLVAGLVKLEIALKDGSRFPHYLHPESVFGLAECLAGCPRLTDAVVMEKSILYRWTPEDFDLDLGIKWELAQEAITGFTRLLRILNVEFGERVGLLAGRA